MRQGFGEKEGLRQHCGGTVATRWAWVRRRRLVWTRNREAGTRDGEAVHRAHRCWRDTERRR